MKETPSTPDAIVQSMLDTAQRMEDSFNELAIDDPGYSLRIGVLVNSWTSAVLMETLRRAAPDVADRLANHLYRCWEDGGIITELLWEWRDNLAAGRKLDEYAESALMRPSMGIFERVLAGGAS